MRVIACTGLLLSALAAPAQPAAWVNVKGQVVLPGNDPIPKRAALVVNQDMKHCLQNGPILDEKILVNPKNRGIANVVVWLRPNNMNPKAASFGPNEIHPADANRKPADVVIDQPCCMFTPRIVPARVGDTIVVKNPAPVAHNFFWTSSNNGNLNVNLAANQMHRFANPLVAEVTPIPFKCTVHPWMGGYVRVFDHPYYAVTDADGKFEIKNAPAGAYRVVYWHETTGFKDGKNGRFGDPVAIKDAGNGTMEMTPTEFEVK